MVGTRQPMAAIYKPTHEIKYYYHYIYMILIHESHVFELQIEKKLKILAVGLIAQLVEHCTCIAEVRVQII